MEREHLIQLRQILTERFNEGELRTLCFDLGVDYDNLSDEGKANRARELVAYVERHNRAPELIRIGKRLRPDILWDDNLTVAPQVGETERVQSPDEERESLKRELAQHKRNLYRLREQKAKFGIVVPLSVLNQIDDAEQEIERIEAILKAET